MIAIINKGPFDDPDPGGERNYELRINNELLITFTHCRIDGLSACLRAAADAWDMKLSGDCAALLEAINIRRP